MIDLPRDKTEIVVKVSLALLPLGNGTLERVIAGINTVLGDQTYHRFHDLLMRIMLGNGKAIDPGCIINSIVILYTQRGNNAATKFVFVRLVVGRIVQEYLIASLVWSTAEYEGLVALSNQGLGGF